MSFVAFWRRNLGFFKLAIATNLEYRVNFIADALLQPIITTLIEMVLWISIFKTSGSETIGGFSKDMYLSYALWGAFTARISISWMYEFRMVNEIDTGTINSLLARPVSFYEYYLFQLLGYKFVTSVISFLFPIGVILYFKLPTDFSRLPLAVLLIFYFLFLVHSMSFIVSTLAFFVNKAYSFIHAKNLAIWLLTGELVPLDLMPLWLKNILLILPFSSGVYIPVAYLTGRVGTETIVQGFISITISLLILNLVGFYLWKKGLREYVGTGA